jgi:prepilin-type N-terminal cleavage/methylation domain-containing protein
MKHIFMHPERRGFTLIELLVVVAVIGILAGLLLPALGRSKRAALSVACLSNLHQIGLGLEMYVQDNEHRLPTCAQLPTLDTNQPSITTVLKSYVPPGKAYECPADHTIYPANGTSYEWNIYLNGASYDRPQDWSKVTQSIVEIIFGGRLNTPILGDAAAHHGAEGKWTGKNALFFEGRVAKTSNKL